MFTFKSILGLLVKGVRKVWDFLFKSKKSSQPGPTRTRAHSQARPFPSDSQRMGLIAVSSYVSESGTSAVCISGPTTQALAERINFHPPLQDTAQFDIQPRRRRTLLIATTFAVAVVAKIVISLKN